MPTHTHTYTHTHTHFLPLPTYTHTLPYSSATPLLSTTDGWRKAGPCLIAVADRGQLCQPGWVCGIIARLQLLGVTVLQLTGQLQANMSKLHVPSYREAKTILRNNFRKEWRQRLDIGTEEDSIHHLDRAAQVTILRPRTGHCQLLSHLHRLKISHSDECPHGIGPQSPKHILQSCPILLMLQKTCALTKTSLSKQYLYASSIVYNCTLVHLQRSVYCNNTCTLTEKFLHIEYL